jgi:hypothetical protein
VDLVDVLLWMAVASLLIPAHKQAWRSDDATLTALIALDVVILAGVALGTSEKMWARLCREDGPVEWATFAAFLLAGIIYFAKMRTGPLLEKIGRAAIGLFCIFVAGEEISWGQRLFAFKPPDAFLERNFQQELNVHNVLMDESGLGVALESKHLVVLIAVMFALVLPALVRIRQLSSAIKLAPPLAFLPAALVVVAAELTYPIDLTGEAAELLLGLVLLATVTVDCNPPLPRVLASLAAPLIAGALLAPITARVIYGSDEEGTKVAQVELELLRSDVEKGATEKLKNKSSVHKRVFTSARDKYVTLSGGAFLEGQATPAEASNARHDRRGYFLDPWNNPYWILWDKKKERGLVYSFGPNRQRDSDVRNSDRVDGDDVIVRFTLE